MVWVLLLRVASAAPKCDDPSAHLDEARVALLEGRKADANAAMDKVVAALSCSPPPTDALLAQLWVIEGFRLDVVDQDEFGVRAAFRSAARLDGSVWFDALGPNYRAIYDEARTDLQGGPPSTLHLLQLDEQLLPRLNSQDVPFPATVDPGLHLLQVTDRRQTVHARMLMVPPGADYDIDLSEVSPAPTTWSTMNRPLLAAGGASVVVGGIAALLSRGFEDDIQDAETVEELNDAYQRQQTLVYSGIGLMGIGAAGIGASFYF
ncbi:MAG: hypothetical protein AAFV53_30995 [Myxococcota bacterium]